MSILHKAYTNIRDITKIIAREKDTIRNRFLRELRKLIKAWKLTNKGHHNIHAPMLGWGLVGKEQERAKKSLIEVYDLLLKIARKDGRVALQARVKSPKSIVGKVRGDDPQYKKVTDLMDLAGIRFIGLAPQFERYYSEIFQALKTHGWKTKKASQYIQSFRRPGYTGINIVFVKEAYFKSSTHYPYVEVQLGTPLKSIVNKLDHDILYKPLGPVTKADKDVLPKLSAIATSCFIIPFIEQRVIASK